MKRVMAGHSKAYWSGTFNQLNGKRKTIQRDLILNAVRQLNIHATAEQVYEHIQKKHPSISRATVYRNLNQMSEAGGLLNIGNFYGAAHYDHNCHKHHHFVCEKCRRVFDVPVCISNLPHNIAGMDDFEIKDFHLNFFGLCRKCKGENPK